MIYYKLKYKRIINKDYIRSDKEKRMELKAIYNILRGKIGKSQTPFLRILSFIV